MPNTNPEKTAQNEYVAYLGQEANSNGYRLVTKQEHNKIIQADRLKKEDKNHKHAIRQLNQQIDSMKPQPQPDPEPEVKTEFDVSEALKNGAYISGTTGSGKSDLAMYHAEAMIQAGVTVLVFDASQDWINRSSIPYYITIEPNVHFQYELNGKSIIFDMSLLSSKQQKDIVKKICVDVWNHQVRNSNRH
jgi:Mrp family chromosome partitioning ATPase